MEAWSCQVKSVADAPRSHNITTSDGRQYRRNRRHQRLAAENSTTQPNRECEETMNYDADESETTDTICNRTTRSG
ncbi:Hypothetical predicted protein [Octopus vulgaris]|uniref:Uncharacterized protein n=1 Tax=Octopus vulgaris TaxID=6645 RepID=A0AA36BAB4_OCTVU|nr:Hypothetical predicted protein [Octopus vulgaris]